MDNDGGLLGQVDSEVRRNAARLRFNFIDHLRAFVYLQTVASSRPTKTSVYPMITKPRFARPRCMGPGRLTCLRAPHILFSEALMRYESTFFS